MRDIITEIWATVKRNKLRTALTGFAVAWGIFMLIFLLGAGNGLLNALTSNSDRLMPNSMTILGWITSKPYHGLKEGRPISLCDQDLETTKRNFTSNIDDVSSELPQGTVTITLGENYVNSDLNGVYPIKQQVNKIELLYGRFINDIDMAQQRKVIVLSDNQSKELSHDISRLTGQHVKVGDLSFTIIGIYKNDQSGLGSAVYIPFTTLRTIYNKGDKVGNIEFSFHGLPSEEANKAFEKSYRAHINANHEAAPDDENSIWIWNRFTQNLQMAKATKVIRTALWIVGIFTLLSGIVGISNIMLITVRERTREIGIRKALGATPHSILRLIIVESIVITTFFGYIGMVMGVIANQYMDMTIGHQKIDTGLFQIQTFLNPTVGLDICIEATLLMVIAGTIAGIFPARKAAKIRPIEALRAE